MEPTIDKVPSRWYNINQLLDLSRNLNSLQLRLLSTLIILKYLRGDNDNIEKDLCNWEFNPTDFEIRKSNKQEKLSEEMRLAMQILPSEMYQGEAGKPALDIKRDKQIMAVITYMICFGSNPYLGKGYYEKVVISHEWEQHYFGKGRIFAYSKDSLNRPDEYYQSRTINLWKFLENSQLSQLLIECFKENSEVSPSCILYEVYKLISQLKTSGSDLKRYFVNQEEESKFLLSDGKYVLDDRYVIIGKVIEKVENCRRDLYLTNWTKSCWEVITAQGKEINIKPGREMPVRAGMIIKIPRLGVTWNVE